MRILFFIVTALSIITVSCKKSGVESVTPDSVYTGTFQRQVSGNGQLSNIRISFSNDSWVGESQFNHYPALCNGTYNIDGGMIHFQNSCAWKADFDWTLILSNDFNITITSNRIDMWREQNGVKDIYTLIKQ